MMSARCLLVGAQTSPHPSLSLGRLKAAADAEPALAGRVRVDLLDLVCPSADEIVSRVAAAAPDVVGFSCYVWNSAEFFEALPRVRAALPEALLVLGGPDVYPQARRVLEAHPAADVVVMGEGELTLPRLLLAGRDRAAWKEIPGLAFLEGGAYVQTPDAPLLADLDALPSPYLTGATPVDERHQRVTFETSRGCPFDCKFCDWPGRRQKPRTFSVDRVLAELEFVLARAPNLIVINFADADIFVDKARAKELVSRARRLLEGTNVVLAFEVYLGRLDDELIRLLDCPNFALEGGVQTATPEALKTVNRFFHREKIEAAVRRLQELAPSTRLHLQLIFGLPGDAREGFLDSLEWARSLRPEGVAAYRALVLPGADMGQHPERYGLEFDPAPPRRVLAVPGFPREDIRAVSSLVVKTTALERTPVARHTLGRLAGLGGGRRRPYLDVYAAFARVLQNEGLLPSDEEAAGEPDAFARGAHEADRLRSDERAFSRLLALLEGFAAARLREGGREALLPAFRHYWRVEAQLDAWVRAARDAQGELPRTVAEDSRGGGPVLWLGLEALSPETALARRAAGSVGEVFHFHTEAALSHRCAERVSHLRGADGFPGCRRGAPAEIVVLSHLLTRLGGAQRERLLGGLSPACAARARLIVWDGLLGASPLERLAGPPLEDLPAPSEWTHERVAAELAAFGWRPRGAPEKIGPSWRRLFERAA